MRIAMLIRILQFNEQKTGKHFHSSSPIDNFITKLLKGELTLFSTPCF